MKQITALKLSEICMAVKKQCTGSYNSKHIYQVDCNNSCEGTEHTYKCGLENCAINKAKCEKFLEFKNLLKKLIATDTTTENFIKSTKMKKYAEFMKAVQKCPNITYTLKADDVCLNGKDCAIRQIVKMRSGDIKILKVILILNFKCFLIFIFVVRFYKISKFLK